MAKTMMMMRAAVTMKPKTRAIAWMRNRKRSLLALLEHKDLN